MAELFTAVKRVIICGHLALELFADRRGVLNAPKMWEGHQRGRSGRILGAPCPTMIEAVAD